MVQALPSNLPETSSQIAGRGINTALRTRLYFADEDEANATDPALDLIEQGSRGRTLLARRGRREQGTAHVLDIHLQGDGETVSFDI